MYRSTMAICYIILGFVEIYGMFFWVNKPHFGEYDKYIKHEKSHNMIMFVKMKLKKMIKLLNNNGL